MSWPEVRLSELCDLQNGYAFKSSDYVDSSNTLSCRMSNIRPGGIFDIDYNARYLPDEFTDKYSQFLLKDGDVVIAMTDLADSPKILGVPTVIKTNGKNILLNQRVGKLVIKDSERVHFPYLQLALNYPKVRSIYKRFAGGGLQINLGKTDLLSVEIPLPPLNEQKRIAAILDKADNLRRKRQEAIALADKFLRAVFLDMFGDPVTNPKGWEVRRFGDVVESQLGKMLSQKAKEGKSPRKYLRNANVRWREFDLSDLLEMDFTEKEMDKFQLQNGDLLVCEGGDVGRCAIWRGQLKDCYYQKALHRVRPDPTILSPEYVQEYFYWMSRRGGLSDSVSEVTFSHLTAEKMKDLKIPAPPVCIQETYVGLFRKIENIMEKSLGIKYVNTECFSSLSQKAFSGLL